MTGNNETASRWDAAARNYQKIFKLGLNDYNRSLLTFWQEQGMFHPGCRVLDVGCGVGKYGVLFAELGCDVTLTDISEGMLALAEKNMSSFNTPWCTFCCDFNEITGEEAPFTEGFDFSISTMSPAIHDVATVNKFSAMTHSCCFLTHFVSWQQPARDALFSKLGRSCPDRNSAVATDCENVLAAIKEAGYDPCVKYVPYNWSDDRTAAEQAEYMLRSYRDSLAGIDPAQLTAAIESLCTDGLFTDSISTQVAWIYWNTGDKK